MRISYQTCYGIEFKINNEQNQSQDNKYTRKYNSSKADWSHFVSIIKQQADDLKISISEINSEKDIETVTDKLQDMILKACNLCMPLIKRKADRMVPRL